MTKHLISVFVFFGLSFAGVCHLHAGIVVQSETLSTASGLSSNRVRDILQDSQGFIWMASYNGLSRYDGNHITNIERTIVQHDPLVYGDNRIMRLCEDKNHLLWMKTMGESVCCYDLRQDRFLTIPADSLHPNKYNNLYFFDDEHVWASSRNNGIARFRLNEDRELEAVYYAKTDGNLPDNQIKFLVGDPRGNVWMGTKRGMSILPGEKNRSADLSEASQTLVYDTVSYCEACLIHQDTVWVMFRSGKVSAFLPTSVNQPVVQLTFSDKTSQPYQINDTVLVGNRWFLSGRNRNYEFDFTSRKLTSSHLGVAPNVKIIKDNLGNPYFCNNTGNLYQFGKTLDEPLVVLPLEPGRTSTTYNRELYHVVVDARGNRWISTSTNGLFCYPVNQTEPIHFLPGQNNEQSVIDSESLASMYLDREGDLWLAVTQVGVTHFEPNLKETARYFVGAESDFGVTNAMCFVGTVGDKVMVATRKGDLMTLSSDLKVEKTRHFPANVYSVKNDKYGHEWICTRGDGLYVDGVHFRGSRKESDMKSDNIFDVLEDDKGCMWVATMGGGLSVAKIPTGAVTRENLQFRTLQFDGSGSTTLKQMAEDRSGWIWMAGNNGLYRFHPDSVLSNPKNLIRYSLQDGNFCTNEMNCVQASPTGKIWVGSMGVGLVGCQIEPSTRQLSYEVFDTSRGLNSNEVSSIYISNTTGTLWIGTMSGMSHFNTQTQTFEPYYFSRQPLGNVYDSRTVSVLPDGRFVSGTFYGLTLVDPSQFLDSPESRKPILSDFRVNGQKVDLADPHNPKLRQSISYAESVELDYQQNTLHFEVFCPGNSKRHMYKYMLQGYDRNWSEPTTRQDVDYKYLKPGTYFFKVRATNDRGVWDDRAETTLKVSIRPPLWQTWWAYVLYLVAFLALGFFIWHLIMQAFRMRQQLKITEELNEFKMAFFAGISHEFRTPLSLIQSAEERLSECPGIPAEARSPLLTMRSGVRRMSRLANQIMEFRKLQSNKLTLSLEESDVIAFVRDIASSFFVMAQQKSIDYQMHFSHTSYRMFFDHGHLDKVTYNIISNAFKYTLSGGKIDVDVIVDERTRKFVFKVTDTGVGVPKDKQKELFTPYMHTNQHSDSIGIGLHLSQQLVIKHRGTLVFSENPEGGSIFTVTLPLDTNLYAGEDFVTPENSTVERPDSASVVSASAEEMHISAPAASDIRMPDLPEPLNNQKILIIEDDNDIRNLLKEELCAYFEVYDAEDGTTGLNRAHELMPDLIVCDVMMPGIDGFEVTRRLRKDFQTCHIPIILLTALGSAEKQVEGIESGADAYISKPFSFKFLLARIVRLIEQRQRLREKYATQPGAQQTPVCTNSRDKQFVEHLNRVLDEHMSEADFNVELFASEMGMSRTVFYNKVRGVLGYAPVEYLRVYRLKRAAELLLSAEDERNISEISYHVGFNDALYFSKCFRKQFGVPPSQYKKKVQTGEIPAEEELPSN
ncbi:MAG: response regulator [Bacteroidales bacterium]|nr:response regulator [Bacteroidales bacterium]